MVVRTSVFQGPRNTRFFERGRSVSKGKGRSNEDLRGITQEVEIEILEPKRPLDAQTQKRIQQEYQEMKQKAIEADLNNVP